MKTRFFNKIQSLLNQFDSEMEQHHDKTSWDLKNTHLKMVWKLVNYANHHADSIIGKMMNELLMCSNNEETICSEPKMV